jgi:hypothetical protein
VRIRVTVMGPWANRRLVEISATPLPCHIHVVRHFYFSNLRVFEATTEKSTVLHTVISLVLAVLPTLLESRGLAFRAPFYPSLLDCTVYIDLSIVH